MRTGIVIGLGETGQPLFEILKEAYPDMLGVDKATPQSPEQVQFMHVCIPYSDDFVDTVLRYQERYSPEVTIIHSTVPIGTTLSIEKSSGCSVVHSPIQGRHNRMKKDLLKYRKWVGGAHYPELEVHLDGAGFKVKYTPFTSTTEKLKLMCLAKYGVSLAFAKYQKKTMGDDYHHSCQWDEDYNLHVGEDLQRPVFDKLTDVIGGHCVTQNTRLLNEQYPNPMLDEVLKYAEESETAPKIWEPCNIYPSAKIGENVSIGAFSEIGHNVVIGDNVRIGAHAFIPEGVIIEDNAWIGPRVTFSNDMYPPSGKDKWQETLICVGARIGAGVCIRPGVVIGAGALIGMGAVVTQDIPAGETWAGIPARRMEKGNDNNNRSQTSVEDFSYMQ
ncbi:hypothetical protein LCGC14_0467250 [marine sediment metagenome]|uniref:PglD N-terminal domain-containing protein n=1 Tax=marine sediment metagenome TaxID=412755 RepID=A0A0F9SW70_9ZZZZ